MQIYEYEVTMKVTDKKTGSATMAQRREHAYTIGDALMQAAMNHSQLVGGTGAVTCDLLHVGPPLDQIELLSIAATSDLVEKVLARIKAEVGDTYGGGL